MPQNSQKQLKIPQNSPFSDNNQNDCSREKKMIVVNRDNDRFQKVTTIGVTTTFFGVVIGQYDRCQFH